MMNNPVWFCNALIFFLLGLNNHHNFYNLPNSVAFCIAETLQYKTSVGSSVSFTNNCPYNVSVFVYPIPVNIDSVRISEEARRNQTLHVCQKCILEQFALEYIVYDFFTQFCGRTYDPQNADYYYLPIIRDAEFRTVMAISAKNRAPSTAEKALLLMMEKNDSSLWRSYFNVTDEYWKIKQGADHIIAMPAPVTNLRHESSQRGFFHYMSHLHAPIFLALEYTKEFVQEYPICSTKKNVVVPYPTTDPDLYSGRLSSLPLKRDFLLYYAGGLHGECMEVRKAIRDLMHNSSVFADVIPKGVRSNQSDREKGFLEAKFCPVPIGDSPSSKRMYDVLNFGCIPVILSDELIWAFSNETGGTLNHREFSIEIPQCVVQFTASQLLLRYSSRKAEFGVLPVSRRYILDLLNDSVTSNGEYQEYSKQETGKLRLNRSDSFVHASIHTSVNGSEARIGVRRVYINPLLQILVRIPQRDIDYLQRNVQRIAPWYRYYQMNVTMKHIPTATHDFPNGSAMDLIVKALQERKQYGIDKLREDCRSERFNTKHRYVSRYWCDRQDNPSIGKTHKKRNEKKAKSGTKQ